MEWVDFGHWKMRRYIRPVIPEVSARTFLADGEPGNWLGEMRTETVIEALWTSRHQLFPSVVELNDVINQCRNIYGRRPDFIACLPQAGSHWGGVPLV